MACDGDFIKAFEAWNIIENGSGSFLWLFDMGFGKINEVHMVFVIEGCIWF